VGIIFFNFAVPARSRSMYSATWRNVQLSIQATCLLKHRLC